jgi:hypothetical protein
MCCAMSLIGKQIICSKSSRQDRICSDWSRLQPSTSYKTFSDSELLRHFTFNILIVLRKAHTAITGYWKSGRSGRLLAYNASATIRCLAVQQR